MRWLLVCLALIAAVPVLAQQQLPVLIIDSNRVYAQTEFGKRLIAELKAEAAEIQAENNAIVQSLIDEERSLTVRRSEMSAESFRIAAAAFDAKAQEIRRVRDAKEVALQAKEAAQRNRFDTAVRNVIGSVMVERNAIAMFEERSVLMAFRGANVTAEVIARIDREMGDGAEALPLRQTADDEENQQDQ